MQHLDVPEWVTTLVRAWRDRLYLHGWTIKVSLALCVNDDPDCHGVCEQFPDIHTAKITFRADIEDTVEWRETIIHELLHVQHARIDHAVERAILPELPSAAQQLAREVYHQHVEAYVSHLATTLYRATCALDYPEESTDHATT